MRGAVLKRHNLMVEIDKVRRLRRQLKARSNSEAVRMAIERELAITGIQEALRALRERGTLEDVFHRVRTSRNGFCCVHTFCACYRPAGPGGVRSQAPVKRSSRV